MTVVFTCGHRKDVQSDVKAPPECHCGERRITNVIGATPRFSGACKGPHVQKGPA